MKKRVHLNACKGNVSTHMHFKCHSPVAFIERIPQPPLLEPDDLHRGAVHAKVACLNLATPLLWLIGS